VLESYAGAIDAAREWIYVENQFFFSHTIFERLDAALRRGVEVIAVVPGQPLPEVYDARKRHPRLFAALGALGQHERFTLAALATTGADGTRRDVYVHAKVAIVDDAWMTIGSANLERRSLELDTELNVVCWDPAVASAFRRELLTEHLGTPSIDRFRDAARTNARSAPGTGTDELAMEVDPARYGE
jgi:phosphatidylserine/phosphatidylglycerophosphate/cardiolipin synthase-like enzyme